jgi:chemotaxis signal transduction protein
MLLLLFKVASRHYAIEARRVVQVVSSKRLQRSGRMVQFDGPQSALQSDASNAQAGLLQWDMNQPVGQTGQSIALVPVIDLAQLLMGMDCPKTIGTRIMLIQDDTDPDRLWGLMAASMVQTWTIDDDLWVESEHQQILMRDQMLIYGLSVDQLLAQVRNSCDQFRLRTVAMERDRTASQN